MVRMIKNVEPKSESYVGLWSFSDTKQKTQTQSLYNTDKPFIFKTNHYITIK